MAVDVLQLLIDIFKINSQLVNEYSTQGPLYQLFYLFFFPAIFIIIFIWILSHAIIGGHKGLRILLSIGVYAFIILQGYYSFFVTISKFWLFGLLILGFMYMLVYRGGIKSGGAKGKVIGDGTGALGKLQKRLIMKMTGQESQLIKKIKADLGQLEGMRGSGGESYGRLYVHVEDELKNLEMLTRDTDPTGLGFTVGGSNYKSLLERFLKLPKVTGVA